MSKIGITERGDAGLDLSWLDKLKTGKVDAAIAITKDPEKLLDIDIPDNVIIHCTITGLPSFWEPSAPVTSNALDAYNELIDKYGGEKVVLRVDPIIPYNPYLAIALDVLRKRRGRVRISFLDAYGHIRDRYLKKSRYDFDKWNGLHAPLDVRLKVLEYLTNEVGELEICGEPGIECTGCVSAIDMNIFGFETEMNMKGQRNYCACLAEKVELLSNRHPCKHNCLYCYWND